MIGIFIDVIICIHGFMCKMQNKLKEYPLYNLHLVFFVCFFCVSMFLLILIGSYIFPIDF